MMKIIELFNEYSEQDHFHEKILFYDSIDTIATPLLKRIPPSCSISFRNPPPSRRKAINVQLI